jgi:hypothetical protein
MNQLEALLKGSFFDWYQVTFTEKMEVEFFVNLAHEHWDFLSVERVSPRVRQYIHAVNLKRGDRVIMHLCWGGSNIGLHVISTGSISHDVANWMKDKFLGLYGVSRADVRIDFTNEGMFDHLVKVACDFAIQRKVKTNHQGDWLTGKAGRTLYVGSKDSVVQVRIYEKGKKEGGDPNWVRLEIQVRPSKSHSKETAAAFVPFQFWQSSKWSHDLMNIIFVSDSEREVDTLGTVWRASDMERSLMALVSQYGNTLDFLASRLPNGWHDLGSHLYHLRSVMIENKRAISGSGDSPYEEVPTRVLCS